MDWPLVAGLGLAVLAGGVVQSTIGFGLAVVAAPFVVLLAPDLMPAALLVPTLRPAGAPALARRPRHRLAAARLGAGGAHPVHPGGRRRRRVVLAAGDRRARRGADPGHRRRCRCGPRPAGHPAQRGRRRGGLRHLGHGRRDRRAVPRPGAAARAAAAGALDAGGLLRRRVAPRPRRPPPRGRAAREQVRRRAGLDAVRACSATPWPRPMRARIDPEMFRRAVLAFCVLASLTVIVRAALA